MPRKRVEENKNLFIKSVYFKGIMLVLIIFAIIGAYFISINSKVKKWDKLIYTGVIADGIDLSGKTKEEATKLINDKYSNEIEQKEISIKVDDKVVIYHYSDIEASYNVENIVDNAYKYGKDLSLTQRYKIIKGKEDNNKISGFEYNKDKLKELEEKVINETSTEPTNATIAVSNGQINITPDIEGYKVDKSSLDKELKKNLSGDVNSKTYIQVSTKKTKAKITADDLSKIKETPMASYSTSYASSDASRSKNVQIATSLVNGTVLLPGEEFSYSETSQKGRGQYLNANVYINNKVQQAEAGGICQVSSTLYNAVMRANIRSTQRTNHSLTVSYVPYGLDATVAWGYLDYKFKNTYDFPIYIQGTSDNRTVTFNVYGDPAGLKGIKYELTSNIIETIAPKIKYENDNTLEKGIEKIESNGQTGYKVESYIIGYKDGVEVSRELIAKDTYATTDTVVKRGTKEKVVEENKVEEQKEEPTQEKNKEENEDKKEE